MQIVLVDNFDSFTYNLVHYLEQLNARVEVIRNDEPFAEKISKANAVVLSPGPGLPTNAGQLMEIIEHCIESKKPLLGVCLGHQAIAEFYGASLKNLPQVMHGQATEINILNSTDIYQSVPNGSKIAHYHSWVINNSEMTSDLESTATSLNGEIMSYRHKELPVWGIQYHPESILTEHGLLILKNWLSLAIA